MISIKHTSIRFFLVCGLCLALHGCTAVGVGAAAGTTAGVAAAREGGIKSSLSDAKIEAQINDLWLKHDFDMFRKINLTVDQGRVLLTGVVQKPEHRVDAVRLAWQPEGVRQVINEVKVTNSEGLRGWARDTWISGRLRAAILFDKNIQSVNYSIDTVQGIIYLMGVAQNQMELDRVIAHGRGVPYVRQVVSYVKLAGTPINQAPMPANAQMPVQQNYQQPAYQQQSYQPQSYQQPVATSQPVTSSNASVSVTPLSQVQAPASTSAPLSANANDALRADAPLYPSNMPRSPAVATPATGAGIVPTTSVGASQPIVDQGF